MTRGFGHVQHPDRGTEPGQPTAVWLVEQVVVHVDMDPDMIPTLPSGTIRPVLDGIVCLQYPPDGITPTRRDVSALAAEQCHRGVVGLCLCMLCLQIVRQNCRQLEETSGVACATDQRLYLRLQPTLDCPSWRPFHTLDGRRP